MSDGLEYELNFYLLPIISHNVNSYPNVLVCYCV